MKKLCDKMQKNSFKLAEINVKCGNQGFWGFFLGLQWSQLWVTVRLSDQVCLNGAVWLHTVYEREKKSCIFSFPERVWLLMATSFPHYYFAELTWYYLTL